MADNVKLVLEFDATGAIQNVQNFGSKLKKETEEASGAFDGLNGKLMAVGAAIATYFTVGAIKNFFGAIISESMEAEESLNQLNGAMQRAGTYSSDASKAMQDFATSMMNMTTIDDDVILGQLAIARNFTKTDEEARKLITAAADLSAAMGTDLGTATELLGRSLDGTAGRLNETVPALRGVSEEALKAGAAIDIVGAAFEGAAANKVKTFEGAMAQASNAFGNLKAAMGDVITQNPMIIAAINELSRLFVNLTGRVTDTKDGMNSWLNEGILALMSGIRNALPYINEMISFLKSLYNTVIILTNAFMGLLDWIVRLGSAFGVLIEKFTGGEKAAYMYGAAVDDLKKRGDAMSEAFAKIGVDPFSKADIKGIEDSFARIAAAAKNNPIDIKTNLNTNKIKDDLKNTQAELDIEAKKKEEAAPKPEEPLVPTEIPTAWELFKQALIKYFENFFKEFSANLIAVSPVLGKSLLFLGAGIVEAAIGVKNMFDIARNSVLDAWMKDSNGHVDYIESQDKDGNIKMIENPTKGDRNFPERPNDHPLTQAFERVADVFRNIDWLGLTKPAIDGLTGFAIAAGDFTLKLASATVMAGVGAAGTAVTSIIGNIGKGEAGAKTAIVETMGAIGAAFDKALGTGNMISDVLKTFLNTLTDPEKMKALIDGFIAAIPVVIDAMIEAIPTLMDGIVKALPILLDGIIKLIPEIMQETARTIGPILKILADKIPDIIIAISENLAPIVEAIIDAMPSVLIKLIGALPRVLGSLIKTIAKIYWDIWWKGIPALLEGITTGISKALSNIGSGLNMGGTSSMSQWGSKAQTYVANSMTALIKAVSDIPKLIVGAFKAIIAGVVVAFKQLISGIQRAVAWIGKTAKVFADVFKNPIQSINMDEIKLKLAAGAQKLFMTLSVDIPMKIWQGVMVLVNWFANLFTQIWDQGVLPLVTWFAGLFQSIWDQGIMPLVTWFAGLFQAIWDQGVLPLVTWFAGLFQSIWDQGILPLVTWFSTLATSIWDQGILPLVTWFSTLGTSIWNQGVIPFVNWFIGLGTSIWNQGVIPLVNWFSGLGTKLWDQGVLPLVNWFKSIGSKIWEALQEGLQKLTGGGGGGGGVSIGGHKLFATGGVVPSGYPNDSYPALLTSNETVVPAGTSDNLFKLIDSLASGGASGNKETNALLRQLIALIASQETTVNVQLDRNVLAKAILTLNKDNRRIA